MHLAKEVSDPNLIDSTSLTKSMARAMQHRQQYLILL